MSAPALAARIGRASRPQRCQDQGCLKEATIDTAAQHKESTLAKWVAGILLTLLVLVMVILILAVTFLSHYNIPSNGAGMAAKAVC